MRRVVIESPLRGLDCAEEYADACLLHSLSLGEAPFASHLFYTRVLDDRQMDQRKLGMDAGFLWLQSADLSAAYVDYGVSEGMRVGISKAKIFGVSVVERKLGSDWKSKWSIRSGARPDLLVPRLARVLPNTS